MFYNYTLKRFLGQLSTLKEEPKKRKSNFIGFPQVVLLLLFAATGMNAQTTLINPATDGGFNSGGTFSANGWTVANQGAGKLNWVVGTVVSSGAITGNSAYVSVDGGDTNSSTGYNGARTVYFYKDVVIPAGQTNIALSFNWKAIGTSWQVFVAPTSVTPSGTDTSITVPATIAGATSIMYNNAAGTGITQNAFGFIPSSFAGTTARLIFMWSSGGSGTNPPAAIDNISLVSRTGGAEIASNGSGNFTNPSTWDAGYVPSSADDVVINAGHTVTIDAKNLGANNLYIAGASAVVQFGTVSDEFTVYNDLLVDGSGAKFNVFETTTGKSLRVGHDITLSTGGRLDISVGSSTAGAGSLTLFGSSVQTIASDGTGIVGGAVTASGTTNTAGVINQLVVSNTSSAASNINWQLNNVRIKSALRLNTARVALGSNKIIIGNYSAIFSNNFTCTLGNGFIGGTIAKWYGNGSFGSVMNPGLDYNPDATALFPSLSATGKNRWAFIYATNTSTAGELAMTYTDANTINTGLSIADGAYMITNRYNGNWAVSTAGSTYASTAGTFSLGLYAAGAFAANDGSSRILNAAAAASGTHINGTTTPFVARSGFTVAQLTSGAFYVGSNVASVQGAATKTSAASGDWNTAGTWSPSGVPSCSDIVTIATGHTVTVSAAANAAGVTVNGTLVNAAGTMTVGCTNNNAIFTNNGTHTVSGGTLAVNGGVYQKYGSTFNQSGGDIIVDSNAAGIAANSVGQGGSSFKIDTANLSLTGGKITIVDPLVNNTVSASGTTVTSFSLTTAVDFTKAVTGTYISGVTAINMATLSSNALVYAAGMTVTGTGIASGTTITSVTSNQIGSVITVNLSQATNAGITTGSLLTFTAMSNGCATVHLPSLNATPAEGNLAVGQIVTGTGIPAGTTITSLYSDNFGSATYAVGLSQPVSGLGTSPITSAQTLTFSGASNGCSNLILTAANPLIVVGQIVGGTGIQVGTTVTAVSGTNVTMSLPATAAISAPATVSFLDGNLNSYAFAYNSTANYAAGIHHTLQFGDGTSTDKASITTYGYLCNMVQGGGTLSLGNLTINALDGTNRYVNVMNALNVQNAFVLTPGSVFKRGNTTGAYYFGGNIINNGTMYASTASINLANFINGVAVPTNLPQTITGTGTYYNNLNPAIATGSINTLTVNNTTAQGVTLSAANFRVSGSITMTAGIIHTSAVTPLYQGVLDLSIGSSIGGNLSDTCFIDGPYSKTIALNQTSATYQIYPVGKGNSYQPIWMGVTGGGIFIAEAFTTNTGTISANAANLSTKRWKVTREGTAGTFTNFNVQVGQAGVAANNIVVQAAADQGTYDTTLGTVATFTAGSPNAVNTTTASAGASFTGNFAYATLPNCSAVSPGNTIADLSISQTVTVQNSSSTGITNGLATVTLQAANAAIVVGQRVSGTGIQAGTTVSAITGTALTLSLPATQTSASQTTLTFFTVQTPTTLCGSQPVALSFQNAIAGNGVVYQWQSSANNTTYTNIAGATAITYSATPTASTYYRCNVTCTAGPLTVASTPVLVSFGNTVATTTPASRCDTGTLDLGATTSTGTINWYAAATGGTALGTGNTYTTPSLSTSTTYYAAAESTSTYTAGKAFTGTATGNGAFSGLAFNAVTRVRLNTVKVYPKQTSGAVDAGAPITIKLLDKNGVIVAGTSPVTFTPATNIGAVTASISNTVTLNYEIPAGTGYKLLATYGLSANNTLGRLSSGVVYPLTTGSISITAGLTTIDGSVDTFSYYNFFDLNVTDVCSSARVPVIAKVGDYISTQPTNANICSTVGATTSISVATSAVSATYTWQYRVVTATITNPAWITITSTNAGAVYANYTTATLGITRPTTALPAKGTQYRVLVDSGCGAVMTSDTSLLNSLAAAKGGTIAVAANICVGGEAAFTLTGYVGTSFQWQSSPISTTLVPGIFTDIAGATGTTYTATNIQLTSDRSYRVVVTNGPCGNTTATTATKTFIINPKSVAGTVTGGGTICSGASGSLKVAGYVGKIQWEYSTNGVTYVNAPKAADLQTVPFGTTSVSSIGAAYVPTNITANVYFRAKITSGVCSTVTTNAVQYVMGTTAFAGVITPASSLICPTTGTTLNLSTATGVITWQKSTNWLTALPTWTNVKNATITLATGNLTLSSAYRAMVTTGACSTVYSDIAVVNVVAKPLAKAIIKNVTTPTGAGATTAMCTTDGSKVLTIGAGYIGDIQWQTSTTSTSTGFTDISEATDVSYTVTAPAVGANYFRAKFTNSCGTSVFGAAVTIWYKDCSITKIEQEEVTASAPFTVVAYPNPYRENFNLDLKTSSEANVGVMVYDMTGRLIDRREVRASDVSEMQIGSGYPSGIYNVIITQGAEVKTVRVVKR